MDKGKAIAMREKLDLSGCDVRVGGVLRRLGVDTVEKLLSLDEEKLAQLKNCGAGTIAKILRFQAEHGKDITPAKPQETIDSVAENGRIYMNKLIAVAIVANDLIEKADLCDRYYFRVSKRRVGALKRSLEALRKTYPP